MTRTIAAHFDGTVIVPDQPVRLPIGEPLQLQVVVAPRRRGKKPSPIIGVGRFRSGVPDLGSNKKHLKDFGK
jgi:hypothetical protein